MTRRFGAGFWLALLLLTDCATPEPPVPHLVLTPARFADLPGWTADDLAAAGPALLTSCPRLSRDTGSTAEAGRLLGTPAQWRAICAEAASLPAGDAGAARAFFERRFIPYRAEGAGEGRAGLFTGYYEATLHGATIPTARADVPIYRRPPDLVTVDLGRFRKDLTGRSIAGRVEGGRLVPYPDRAAIEDGTLAGKGLELAWADSAADAFFLEIQGSGRLILDDGRVLRLHYDGQNGRDYVAIGRVLVKEQGVPAKDITMPFLRRWIAGHGQAGRDLMRRNPSYVFFKAEPLADPDQGPQGAEGVALTPGRSLAVDPRFVPYGLPAWIDAEDPTVVGGRWRHLAVAQDTGGAIKGPVRADVFFGYGDEAAAHAGVMKGEGGWWLLGVRPEGPATP